MLSPLPSTMAAEIAVATTALGFFKKAKDLVIKCKLKLSEASFLSMLMRNSIWKV